MLNRQYVAPTFLILGVTLLSFGCGDTPTYPGGTALAKGKPNPPSPRIELANFSIASSLLTIAGDAVNYTVDLVNSGGKQDGVILQGEIGQLGANGVTSAVRAAGGTYIDCGKGQGLLPHGTCPSGFTAQASNSTGGFGTLVPGPASLIVRLLSEDGSQLTAISVPITLQ